MASELVERARRDGVDLTRDNGLSTALAQQVLQTGLEVEMTDHLGSERHAVEGRNSGNSRNGSYPKTVTAEVGQVDLRVPRDRKPDSNRPRCRKADAASTACPATSSRCTRRG